MNQKSLRKLVDNILVNQGQCLKTSTFILKNTTRFYMDQAKKYDEDKIKFEYEEILKYEHKLIEFMFDISDSLNKILLEFDVECDCEHCVYDHFFSFVAEEVGIEPRYADSIMELFADKPLEDVCPKRAMKLILNQMAEFYVISDKERKGA